MMDQNKLQGYAGSKRRGSSIHNSSDEDLSDSDQKVVQTTKSKGIVNVQLFIRKAFAMINECDDAVAEWTPEGDKFVVKDKEIFASRIIPQYYDHNNYSSFTRQLNFYGFTREQSMTIKVSNLSSLAVGQETFYHENFQNGRPDLLKKLQRRSNNDAKNGKKRKKSRTEDDATLATLQNRLDTMEQQNTEMFSTMNQVREENYTSASAIRTLQAVNIAKDAKVEALEKRLTWLERKTPTNNSNHIHQQDSFVPQGQRLNVAAFSVADNIPAPAPVGNNATLVPHPRMKRAYGGNNPRDVFSFESTNVAAVPSRETSLDLGLLANLTRDTSLMSWLPRQDIENASNNNNNNVNL